MLIRPIMKIHLSKFYFEMCGETYEEAEIIQITFSQALISYMFRGKFFQKNIKSMSYILILITS